MLVYTSEGMPKRMADIMSDSCQVEYQIKCWSMCEFKCQNSFQNYVKTISVVGDPSKKVLF